MNRKPLISVFVMPIIIILILLCSCSGKKEIPSTGINSIEDLTGKKIGILTGSNFDRIAKQYIKDARLEYFNFTTDLCVALEAKKIDAYLEDEPIMRILTGSYPNEYCLAMLQKESYGFIFPKNDEGAVLRNRFNEFLAKIKADGTLEKIDFVWFGDDEPLKTVDFESLTGENGTLNFAICSSEPPFTYIKDGKLVGYEVDIAVRFCREYGYAIEITDSVFSGVLAAISSGKADFAAATVSITEERKQTMHFSEPHYVGGVGVVVMHSTGAKNSVSGGIAESFAKTFIREGRWKLFAGGIGVTILITAVSAISGTAAGFLLYLVYRKKNRVFNKILDVFMDILEKTPVVVVLMILYFVILGPYDIDGVFVSVIGFSIMFACGFVKTLDVGIKAIDNGQREASLSLGFSDKKTFLLVILPQAARHFMPNYCGNIVSLLKGTAIVGYVAVQDLTKVGDIVRSRTYEAFFPLIATALIYFVLAWLLTLIVKRIETIFDFKSRSAEKILKGVKHF